MEIEIKVKIQESPSDERSVPNKYQKEFSCSLLSSHSVTSEALWKSEVTRYLTSQINPPAALLLSPPSPTEAFAATGDPPREGIPPLVVCPS